MRALRIDFHVHTRVSPDGLDDPCRMVRAARSAGLDGIAITDHDRSGAYGQLIRAGLACPSGAAVDGFLVIPGVEVSTNQGHVIVLGSAFDTPALPGGIDAADLIAFARGLGCLTVAAHPYDRFRSGVGHRVLDALAFDAVEACNSKTFDRHANRLAADHAARAGLPALAGSDAHEARTVGRAHTLVMAEELTLASVLRAVRLRRVTPVVGAHTRTELWRYWVRGWLTRPWLLDLSARAAWRMAGAMMQRQDKGEHAASHALTLAPATRRRSRRRGRRADGVPAGWSVARRSTDAGPVGRGDPDVEIAAA